MWGPGPRREQWRAVSRRGGRARCGSRGSWFGLGLLPFVFFSAHLRPRPRPLTPDPPLPQRAITTDPDRSHPRVGVRAEEASEAPAGIHPVLALQPARGMGSGPYLGYPGGAFRPSPSPGSRLSSQTPLPRAAWSLIPAQAGLPPPPPTRPPQVSPRLHWRRLRGTGL